VIKKYHVLAQADDPAAAQSAYRQVVKRLDQAAAKNLVHKNKAARTKSRLAALMRTAPGTGA
jgi:small subunit ribosomal protein S20